MTATELETVLPQWPTGTKHYRLDDGSYIVVEVGETDDRHNKYVEQITNGAEYTYTKRPTVIVRVDENGNAQSLDRLAEFPPGTPHEDAIRGLINSNPQ